MHPKLYILARVLLGAFTFYLAYCALLFFLQRWILFPRPLTEMLPRVAPGQSLEKVWLRIPSGKVEAWFLPPEAGAGPAPAAIFAHGNAELIDLWPEALRPLARLGFGVLLVEYPGYGRSEGSPSQQSVTDAFVAARDMLAARKDVDPGRIVYIGRSLGGGAVCALAAKHPPAALILLSTFTGVSSFARQYFAPGFLVLDRFDNLSVVRDYPGPTLVVHGTRDRVVPYAHGVALSRAAPRGRLVTYNAGHNDCPPDWPAFWQEIERFLANAGILSAG